jgi:outer membrane protein TolC
MTLVDQLVTVLRAASELFDDLSARQEVPAIDAMASSQRYAQTLALRDEIQKKMLTTRGELGALLGQPSVVIETGTLSRIVNTNFLCESASRFDLKKTALQNRQDVAAAYWRTQVAQAMIREGRAMEIPWFTHIQGSYGWSRSSENPDIAWNLAGGTAQLDPFYQVSIDDTESTEWRVEAAITIPLFSIGRATRIPAAEYKRSLSALGAATKVAIAQVDGALSYLQGTEERSSFLESEFVARSESARRLLGEMEQRADLPPGDLEKVKEVAIEMDRELLKDRHEQILSLIRLEQALGMSLDEAAATTAPASRNEPKAP